MPPLFSLTGLKAVVLPILGLCWAGQLALASGELSTANVIMGGAERRCSSFSGSAKSPDCTADWDTILRNDPALQGIAPGEVLYGMDYPEPVWTYQLTAHSLQALRLSPNSLIDPNRKATLLAHFAAQLQVGETTGLSWQALQDKLVTNPAQSAPG